MPTDYRDLVIADLADVEANLREQITQLVDLIADLAYENAVLFQLYGREHFENLHGTRTIRALRAKQQRQRPAA